ncbi:hypothetical protein GMD88_08700 [Pseudoflavonifractor sp. BIOML-A6]|nr:MULTISPECIES: hypothetical protein [unclassified Pseudoflavonifractor]MTQ96474.1 hypothetical protein [Pseudoflavonifractor sp. BIOML-A16]MTR05864.1 hypothetical protein [Pseudoflavonifractor sp. BIOML-A15]MTR31238.1 hypothetical protein [Pseudoflavonifractor sp. BIOML-A14]MTR72545.1 hypothetical protein [Pseudoflavonifractor sp. BIOML-A18]MTS60332.1 hypothetical protein [Pseudoflavonifractor sp. BIOML-A7]MTS63646.1 hypothetical protein [Pseudoflavonifractor sp. BIOML-A5]MTS82647.1 hypoth
MRKKNKALLRRERLDAGMQFGQAAADEAAAALTKKGPKSPGLSAGAFWVCVLFCKGVGERLVVLGGFCLIRSS